MKAAVFYEPKDIRVEEVPEPTIAEDEVLVEVSACGFCGSDVEYYYGKSPVGTATGKGPLVLGHEFSGKVVGLGKIAGTYGLKEGDRVAVCPIQSCGACNSCRARPSCSCTARRSRHSIAASPMSPSATTVSATMRAAACGLSTG